MNVFMARSDRGFSLSPRGTSGERVGERGILAGTMQKAIDAKTSRGEAAQHRTAAVSPRPAAACPAPPPLPGARPASAHPLRLVAATQPLSFDWGLLTPSESFATGTFASFHHLIRTVQ